jgi:hypothetical protein
MASCRSQARRLDELEGHARFALLHAVGGVAFGAQQQQAGRQRRLAVDGGRQCQAAGARLLHVEQHGVVGAAAGGRLP